SSCAVFLGRDPVALFCGGAGRRDVAARLGGTQRFDDRTARAAAAPVLDPRDAIREHALAIPGLVLEQPAHDAIAQLARQPLDHRLRALAFRGVDDALRDPTPLRRELGDDARRL